MPNERITENIVRMHFNNDPLFSSVKFEEQKSTNIRIAECLAKASKSGSGKNIGKPEFIITFPTQNMDYVIIAECKSGLDKHECPNRDKPKDFAVDGAIHYSKYLAPEFHVLSLAVSGEDPATLQVSCFLQKKGDKHFTELPNKQLLSIFDYVKTFKNEQLNYNLKDVNIVEKAIKLNDDFHACSIAEGMRNTLVSGILLSLQDETFKAAYPVAGSSLEIANLMLTALSKVLDNASVRNIEDMMGVYRGILNEPLVKETTIKKKKAVISSVQFFKDTISYLQKQVFPLMEYEESGYDILGRFYTEFIRYAASKQKQGLVLTPSHITDLFCDLVELKVNDVVYDPCCGTGGFLIAAMKKMFSLAGGNSSLKDKIRSHQLLGVELRPEMFTFACANMILRGDGKSNIFRGDCFDDATVNRIKSLHPTKSFLNPPYDQGTSDQLAFVVKALDVVAPQNGRVAAIVQMSCAIKDDAETKAVRKLLLDRHKLKAVLSMPDDLFYPIGVVTCIMVFEAGTPNKGNKTWFGYLKNDGFVKRKNKGRIDHFSRWSDIKATIINAYKNSEEIAGISVKKEVAFDDEWCAEAYMETDYSKITVEDFDLALRQYVIFKTIGLTETSENDESSDENEES